MNDMIRGVNRQIVIVKPDDSDIFEQAIFFVSPQASRKGLHETDMLTEAKRIIARRLRGTTLKRKRSSSCFAFSTWPRTLSGAFFIDFQHVL